eukprot:CAMPEP_0197484448 /NCGR_PEP_ID=MMETSP1309-20131121/57394_1 /TAXON_ID=464262 /ORGANISM="Genus nov. species nov., Strain RCC998" /LENGTH=793 /DNA_ID=CAMNT_0043027087 /DNA_START=217 /DNA_END=2600 /DNA_ORIENTATION=-
MKRSSGIIPLLCTCCLLASVFAGALGARREERIKRNEGESDSGLPYVYVDNLAPGLSDRLCEGSKGTFLGPYLQSGGDTRTIIRWSSQEYGVGVVCYGDSPGNMTQVSLDAYNYPIEKRRQEASGDFSEEEGFREGSEHSVVLQNLRPDTKYFYVAAVVSQDVLSGGGAQVASTGSESFEEENREMRNFLFPESGDAAGAEEKEEESGNGDIVAISPSNYYSFTTFPEPQSQPEAPIRVWAIGDSGMGDYKARKVRDTFVDFTGGDWDLTLGLGDLAYFEGQRWQYEKHFFDHFKEQNARVPVFTTPGNRGKDWEYQKRFFNYLAEQNARVPVFTTPGNHDRPTSDMWSQTGPYFDMFTNPGDGESGGVASHHKSYYSFDYGPVHFVSVDSDQLGLKDDPGLYEWLEKDLAQAQKGNYSWIVAITTSLRGKDWEYQKRFFNYLAEQNARVPVFTTPGNHDAFTADMKAQTGPYFELFTNPGDGKSGGVASHHKSYYSFDYGPIHFVSVDSHHLGLHDDPTLYEWLEKDLAQAQRGNYSWIVAYHHQPPYSKGSHDSDSEYECYKLRQNLVPMFEKYGVDLVLAGHSHSYERSHLLNGHFGLGSMFEKYGVDLVLAGHSHSYERSHLLNGHFGSSYEAVSDPSVVKARWERDAEGVDTLVKSECGPHSGTVYIVTGNGAKTSGGALNHEAMTHSQNVLGSVLLEFNGDNSMSIYMIGSELEPEKQVLDHAIVYKDDPWSCSRRRESSEALQKDGDDRFAWESGMRVEAYGSSGTFSESLENDVTFSWESFESSG